MSALTALLRNDLVLYFSNRRALIMSIAAPIAIAAFFGALFDSSSSKKPVRVPIAVVDEDHSDIAQRIVTGMKADAALEVQELPAAQAALLVRGGKLRAVLTLPAGFGEQAALALFRPRDKPVLAIEYDPSQAMALAVVRGLAMQYVMQAVGESLISGKLGEKFVGDARSGIERSANLNESTRRELLTLFDSVDRLQKQGSAANGAGSPTVAPRFDMPFTTREQEVTSGADRPYNSYAHAFAGMGVQFILFMGIDLGIGVLLARRLGLWKRLRAAPLSRATLLASRIVSGSVIALVLLAIIYAAAIAFFGVRIDGSVVGMVGIAIAFALLTSTFGLLIAALGKTPEATRGLAIFATLLLVMLGGAWVPSFVFPEWLQKLSLFVPTRWAVDGLDAMTWRGLGADAAIAPIGVLLGFSALFAALAVWRFDWNE
ncbi:MAG: ABC transporter permease [Betaproteobacteria bacterium]